MYAEHQAARRNAREILRDTAVAQIEAMIRAAGPDVDGYAIAKGVIAWERSATDGLLERVLWDYAVRFPHEPDDMLRRNVAVNQ